MPEENLSLILRPAHSLQALESGGQRIVAEMVSDAIALAGESGLAAQKRFKIGEIELCEPDYRQCLHWASSLELAPEVFLERLLKLPDEKWLKSHFTLIEDGQLRRILWDGDLLPIERFKLIADLQTQYLLCKGRLHQIDLSHVPKLNSLYCSSKGITELNLSPVPNLTLLNCSSTRITELDLSPVPKLTWLWCSSTEITKLDLSHVPNLTELNCSSRRITKVDLSHVPNLTKLVCSSTGITELDLSPVPNLTELNCDISREERLLRFIFGAPDAETRISELDVCTLLNLKLLAYDKSVTRLVQRPDQNF